MASFYYQITHWISNWYRLIGLENQKMALINCYLCKDKIHVFKAYVNKSIIDLGLQIWH